MKKSKTAGFSLIEILVSILVLAVGLIGAAGMQLTALRTTQQSRFQADAMQLAVEIANQLRSSKRLNKAEGGKAKLLLDYKAGAAIEAPSVLCYTVEVNCRPDELMNFNIYIWTVVSG